jgi:hypothetical protein
VPWVTWVRRPGRSGDGRGPVGVVTDGVESGRDGCWTGQRTRPATSAGESSDPP